MPCSATAARSRCRARRARAARLPATSRRSECGRQGCAPPQALRSLSEYFTWPRPRQISPKGVAEPTRLGSNPIRRRQRRMRGNLQGYEGLARPFARAQALHLAVPVDLCAGASAALHGLPVVTTTGGAARLASAPSPCQRGSREILRQAPSLGGRTTFHTGGFERSAARGNLVVGCAAFPSGGGECRVARVDDEFFYYA